MDTALLPVVQVPEMAVALWMESYTVSWAREGRAARKNGINAVNNILGAAKGALGV